MNHQSNELHVIFGTGPLGKATARELVALGHRVKIINRSGKTSDLPPSVEVIKGDAHDHNFTRQVTTGASTVYQCAQPAYHQWAGHFPKLQASILEAAARNNARLVLADNLYMYGEPGGKPLLETNPYNPQTLKGRVRSEMARTALEAHESKRVRVALVRGSNFFGPEDHNQGDLIFKPAVLGKTINLLGKLDQPHTFTYTKDFGRALAILGTVDSALEARVYGRAWHVPSAAPITQAQLLESIERHTGQKPKYQVGGALILNIMGLFNPTIKAVIEMLYEWNQPFVMDSSDFQKTFGMTPTPLETAVRETLIWNRQQLGVPGQLAQT
jgi:nucleoside-diphosphate-sugar epimerase